jgi:predicted ATP-dependent endonuclease of OLD family
MSKIESISAKNYKGFGNLDLSIKPITVLLGSNSCGKSSIINLLLMLTQSIDTQEELLSPLRINGPLVGLGEPDNIIRNRNEKNILSISIKLRSDDATSIDEHFGFTKDEFASYINHFTTRLYQENKNTIKSSNKSYDIINHSDSYFENDKKYYTLISNCLREIRYFDKKYTLAYPNKSIKDYLIHSKMQRTLDSLSIFDSIAVCSLTPKIFNYSISLNKESKNKLSIDYFEIKNEHDEVIIKVAKTKNRNSFSITSDVIDNRILNNSKKDIIENMRINSLIPGKKINERAYYYTPMQLISKNPVANIITRIVDQCSMSLQEAVNKSTILHVSPLRAFPQRYYLLDKTILRTELDTSNGTELAEILKRNQPILTRINKLLRTFNLEMKVDNINDVIHKITVVQDGVSLEITDVGFGISQVIPILVQAFISPSGSITIIEQPEIHLHPRMQAWLVDALIEEALKRNKRFIIETHSEAIIRRIRRRVVENSFDLQDNDVIIYDIQKDENDCSFLKEIEIKPNGDIIWPDGFLDVEIEDLQSIQKAKRDMALKQLMANAEANEGRK